MSPGFEAYMHLVAPKPSREQRYAVPNTAQPEHVGVRRRGGRIAVQRTLMADPRQTLSIEPLEKQWIVGNDADDRHAGRVGGGRNSGDSTLISNRQVLRSGSHGC